MITALRSMARSAAQDTRLLAYHLADFTPYELCCRLDCTLTTALLLTLSATPRSACWRADVARLAADRGVDPSALAALLRDAEAIALPQRIRS